MPKGSNEMENKSDEHFIIMQSSIEDYKQDSDERMTKFSEEFKTMFAVISNQINTMLSSSTKKNASTNPEPNTLVSANRRAPPLEGGHSIKICGMWTLKHEISSSKFYELLVKTELKVSTDLYLKNFYNHINMCLNEVTRLREYLLTGYQSIKIHSEFE